MYAVFPTNPDPSFPDFWADADQWFEVEGDLDDFIFFDPCGLLPESSGK